MRHQDLLTHGLDFPLACFTAQAEAITGLEAIHWNHLPCYCEPVGASSAPHMW